MSGSSPAETGLASFELPKHWVEPALRALRLANTALDSAFYDTSVLTTELLWRGEIVTTQTSRRVPQTDQTATMGTPCFAKIDLGALSNPEGCILVVDSAKAPFITRFDRVDEFIAWMTEAGDDVRAVTITGVGSSALGSAAFAWNASMALGERVAAIVPGYGVADVVNQALGGWFGFGVVDWIESLTQKVLAQSLPGTSRVGHGLLASTPGHTDTETGGLEFRTGSPASDVLHALLTHVPGISVLMGHSKGALAISNALRSLEAATTRQLSVMTFGCPIDEAVPAARYIQFLGNLDVLGWLNSWGHQANRAITSHHSTNTMIPLSMPVAILSRLAMSSDAGSNRVML